MKRSLFAIILLTTITFLSSAQEGDECSSIVQYARNILTFNREHPQEKVYLHMDNRSYFIGDTIWFKAYVMNAISLKPSSISGILYVELLNEYGIEMEHKKLRLEGGMCYGDFILKEEYRTGYYEIRAYTRDMLNFGNEKMPLIGTTRHKAPENVRSKVYPIEKYDQTLVADANHCQFSRVFPVYMKPEKPGLYKQQMEWYPLHTQLAIPEETEEELRDDSLRINFYPEGGSLVNGVPSRIAVEVTDQWGRIKSADGYITQGRFSDEAIGHFSAQATHRGRGIFTLCPQEGKSYFAHVEYKGKHYRYLLPDVEKSGYVMTFSPPLEGGDASFSIAASDDRPATLLGWTLQCRGALTMVDTFSIAPSTSHKVTIPQQKLTAGVNQLTLFDARGEVFAERLFFVCPSRNQASISLTGELPDSIPPFDKVELNLQVKNPKGWDTSGTFSIAITDADERSTTFDTGDIRSELLLSSDLKGFIRDVDSYFQHDSDSAMVADLDLLMMVQGWRRYEWKTMAGIQPYKQRYRPEKGLLLDGYVITDAAPYNSGSIFKNSRYRRLPNLTVDISIASPEAKFSTSCLADSAGEFHVDFGRLFHGEALMTIKLRETDGETRKDGIDSRLKFSYPVIWRVFSPSTTPYHYYQTHTPEDDELLAIAHDTEWQMDFTIPEVSINKRRKRKSEINFEHPDIVIDYFKEWNNVIDRGVPLANYFDKDENLVIKEEEDTTFDMTKKIRPTYTFGRARLWGGFTYDVTLEDPTKKYLIWQRLVIGGDNNGYDSTALKISQKRYFKYYRMPKTIRVYTNLISRNKSALPIDHNTDHRNYAYMVVDYLSRKESPLKAPYILEDGVRDTYYEGYSRVRSFYSPDYSECLLPDSADYRRTLYWNPEVLTDYRGRATVSFYNNAQTKRLHIRAEGFTRNGEFIVYDSDKQKQ